MRLIYLIAFLLLPQYLLAQFKSFEPGSYTPANSRAVRLQGQLKLRNGELLIVKGADGKKLQLTPYDVSSFQIGEKHYTTASGFEVGSGLMSDFVGKAFVQIIDSGQVMLLRYEYTTANGPHVGAGGVMTGGGTNTQELYLLRWTNDYKVYPISANWLSGGGQKFRQAILPHLSKRPDLAKLVEEKKITLSELPNLVRAINTGQPYSAAY
ncbi:hypothetical protein LRS06_15560 [Hymenobacter sp. J193]|uniref:hypothetical protein n=1 Tax=Hymenobacter sp. J193 TaxID=2898429 RepID=UPI0021519B71|nr:hypothetical protein [Hymenobacter sp. J193]MCR5889154.1 hypothetical protein [Hymenobacter sp. J193]